MGVHHITNILKWILIFVQTIVSEHTWRLKVLLWVVGFREFKALIL